MTSYGISLQSEEILLPTDDQIYSDFALLRDRRKEASFKGSGPQAEQL